MTKMPVEQLVDWLAPDDIDMTGEPESFVQLRVGRRLMVLSHKDGACGLLTSSGLCAAYEARPAPCAAYPFSVERSEGRRKLELLPDAPCAIAGDSSLLQLTPESEAVVWRAVVQVEDELYAFVSKVSRWNRMQRRRMLAGRTLRNHVEFLASLEDESR